MLIGLTLRRSSGLCCSVSQCVAETIDEPKYVMFHARSDRFRSLPDWSRLSSARQTSRPSNSESQAGNELRILPGESQSLRSGRLLTLCYGATRLACLACLSLCSRIASVFCTLTIEIFAIEARRSAAEYCCAACGHGWYSVASGPDRQADRRAISVYGLLVRMHEC